MLLGCENPIVLGRPPDEVCDLVKARSKPHEWRLQMGKPNFSLTRIFVATLLVGGAVGIIAVVSDYSGKIDIKLGPGGLEFRVHGQKALPPPSSE